MARYKTKQEQRQVRRYRIRKKVVGGAERPRISVFRSLNHIYAQLIDDVSGRTLATADDKSPEIAAKLGDAKGKGIKYAGETIRRKAGKAAGAGAR